MKTRKLQVARVECVVQVKGPNVAKMHEKARFEKIEIFTFSGECLKYVYFVHITIILAET